MAALGVPRAPTRITVRPCQAVGHRTLGSQWHGDNPKAWLRSLHPQAWQHPGDVGQLVPSSTKVWGRHAAAQG